MHGVAWCGVLSCSVLCCGVAWRATARSGAADEENREVWPRGGEGVGGGDEERWKANSTEAFHKKLLQLMCIIRATRMQPLQWAMSQAVEFARLKMLHMVDQLGGCWNRQQYTAACEKVQQRQPALQLLAETRAGGAASAIGLAACLRRCRLHGGAQTRHHKWLKPTGCPR